MCVRRPVGEGWARYFNNNDCVHDRRDTLCADEEGRTSVPVLPGAGLLHQVCNYTYFDKRLRTALSIRIVMTPRHLFFFFFLNFFLAFLYMELVKSSPIDSSMQIYIQCPSVSTLAAQGTALCLGFVRRHSAESDDVAAQCVKL